MDKTSRTGPKQDVQNDHEGKGGVMERERWKDRVCRAMQPICNCFSVAAKQAREAEIDVPSKRSFRLIYGSGNESSAPPIDVGNGLEAGITRTKIGLRVFLDCLNDAKNRVEQSRTDVSTRRVYYNLPE